jgi:uncharacterized membrane protein
MATLTALKFPTVDGAQQMLGTLQNLQQQHLITIQDAAIVSWPEDKSKPKTRQLTNVAGMGALNGAFWGMLFGLIFLVPLLGAAIGAAMGALSGSLVDVGINDDFIKQVREKVTPGTSALFLLTSGAVRDRIADAVKGMEFEIIATNLSQEEEAKLKAAFEDEYEPAAEEAGAADQGAAI